ncbi:30S ribosomal protein S11, chloroplastic [Terramyces sp. JEL0728]|nr:30S ribosomal protein S11, chloroplastic [Terramyces sp. JEL0728]
MLRTIIKRTFYSFNLPKETKTLKLDDGSTLLYRMKETVKQEYDESKLPPRVHSYPQRDRLTPEQIREIQKLRAEDPDTNTVLQLSKKYNTFPAFILKITECPPERKKKLKLQQNIEFENLPDSRKKTLIDRMRRKALWYITNKFMIQHQLNTVEQSVEWMYCFDVHCNAFVPFFLFTYVVQFFFLFIVTKGGFFSRVFANTIYLVAGTYYFLITFLGFNALPFLKNTWFFLYPIVLAAMLYVFSIFMFNTEKAYQFQQGVFQGKSKIARWSNEIGLGFKTPKEAVEGTYIDKKCPFTSSSVSIRGRILTGVVVSNKMKRTIIIRREYLHFIKKYNRYEKRHKNLAAHISPCFIGVVPGDQVTVGQCRPLSKTVRFNVLKVQKKVVKGTKSFAKF